MLTVIETPAHVAIRESQMWAFQILLKAGCKIDLTTTNGDSLAHYAVKTVGNAPQFLRILASKGADLRSENNAKHSPLTLAKEKNQTRALTALKELGINYEASQHTNGDKSTKVSHTIGYSLNNQVSQQFVQPSKAKSQSNKNITMIVRFVGVVLVSWVIAQLIKAKVS